jgi:hypothetical protein
MCLEPSKGGEAPQFTNGASNGSGAQQGREPVNGVAGAGTAGIYLAQREILHISQQS